MYSKFLNIKNVLLGLVSALLLLSACDPEEELVGPDRLFRPTIKGVMESRGNWLGVSWQKNKGAIAYKVEISRDTFKTIERSAQVDTNYVVFNDLEWDMLYQVQVQALAGDPAKNSGVSFLGEMKTAKFPTILTVPTVNDVTDVAALVKWTNSGATASALRVYKVDNRQSPIQEIELTEEDLANQFKLVTGLTAGTPYVIYAYSGEEIRGWEYYTTKAAQVFAVGSNIVDLRGMENDPTLLQQTLQSDLPAGSVIVLERGMTYTITSTPVVSGALTIVSGLGFGPVAKVIMSSDFNFAVGSTVDSLKFRDLNLRGTDFAGRYVMNPNVSGATTVGNIIFEACTIKNFRGITRFRGPITVSSLNIKGCLVDSISNYGITTIDDEASKVDNIRLLNSTFARTEVGIVSKSNSNSVVIENCTFYKFLRTGRYLAYYRTAGADNVTNGVKIYNSILGPGWAAGEEETAAIHGVRATANVDAMGTYSTSGYNTIASTYQIPGLLEYGKPATALFENPENLNFKIKDATFGGRNTAGDPRWR
ncbi:DUF5123 domain-containing protein [Pontibacter beigongshangensis]|uniref:DUF5123 domain-containing protein n=1 Tax=Pontibacter beigongshangensis TaxID=2574733 RepID=UPI0016503120|nr:DUF5123 domain-containing protein [Pontibacter beigongshangensis]